VLSVLLQYADSVYPFGIFKLFLNLFVCFRFHYRRCWSYSSC